MPIPEMVSALNVVQTAEVANLGKFLGFPSLEAEVPIVGNKSSAHLDRLNQIGHADLGKFLGFPSQEADVIIVGNKPPAHHEGNCGGTMEGGSGQGVGGMRFEQGGAAGKKSFAAVLLGIPNLNALLEPITEGDVEDDDDLDEVEEDEVRYPAIAMAGEVELLLSRDKAGEGNRTSHSKGQSGNVVDMDLNKFPIDTDDREGDQRNDVSDLGTSIGNDGAVVVTSSSGRVEIIFEDVVAMEENVSLQGGEFSPIGKKTFGSECR
ncbi:hypothetical protein NE237_018270 [Protea cynaroides]|uniref:Uncharacterized protein n=1 Tax=Protea cynaroides TaxID=273540 RepID=A0A9Q0K9Q2_9MAGN|nr:hypothetical protein NE237_018270 [Protea cynaroides]